MILTRESEELAKKIDKSVFPGMQGGPHMNNIAAKAVAFGEALRPSFKIYSKQVISNARAMANIFTENGSRMITGGTDNHLILLDVWKSFGISGGEAETLLDSIGITLNKNIIPDDTRKPMDPSGIRFGTPALTTRGFTEKECAHVAELMLDTLTKHDDATIASAQKTVRELAKTHPIPESFA